MEEDVIWLQIAMDDGLAMKIGDSLAYLIHDVGRFNLADGADSFLDGLAQVVVECALHDGIKVKKIVEEAVYFDDVRMVGVLLDL